MSTTQPLGDILRRILLSVIHQASPLCEQKQLIMIAREEGVISDGECERMIAHYGLVEA